MPTHDVVCRMLDALARMKRSHLELRALAAASKFGHENALTLAISEVNTSCQQLAKWYEEGHFLIDDFVRVHDQIGAVKEALHPGGKAGKQAPGA